MTVSIGQLTYSVFPPVADPGTLATNGLNHIVSAPAIEAINPGRVVALNSDNISVQQIQGTRGDTTTVPASYGIALLLTAREGLGSQNTGQAGGAAYAAGDMVPVLRRGAVYAEWKGTTIPQNGTVNVYQSSTLAADRGKLTDAAAASTAGAEIGPLGNRVQSMPSPNAGLMLGTGNIIYVEVNYPGAL